MREGFFQPTSQLLLPCFNMFMSNCAVYINKKTILCGSACDMCAKLAL